MTDSLYLLPTEQTASKLVIDLKYISTVGGGLSKRKGHNMSCAIQGLALWGNTDLLGAPSAQVRQARMPG